MNGKRYPDEPYDVYKKRLKDEAKKLKAYLRGRIIWTSKLVMADPKDTNPIASLRRLVVVKVRGTFNRFLGHRMPNSDFEKQKHERMVKKLKKKGLMK